MKTHALRCIMMCMMDSAERYTTQYALALMRPFVAGRAHLKEFDRLLIRSFCSLFLFSKPIIDYGKSCFCVSFSSKRTNRDATICRILRRFFLIFITHSLDWLGQRAGGCRRAPLF
jgi:hypothetical protein